MTNGDSDYTPIDKEEYIMATWKNLDTLSSYDKLSGLKTQFPNMFESGENKGGFKVLGDNRLPGGREENTLTKDEILKKPYAERAALYAENPDAYNEAMKN